MEENAEIKIDELIIRRSDHPDSDLINDLIDINKRSSFENCFGKEEIINLIENCLMSITVLASDAKEVLGFASFDDFCHCARQSYDKKSKNDWEHWIPRAFTLDKQNTLNTLFCCYEVISEKIDPSLHDKVFKKILQCLYNSQDQIEGIFIFLRGEVEIQDEEYCFNPIKSLFTQITLSDPEILKNFGMNSECRLFYTNRITCLPYVEMRFAREEDHDDLANVFNNQSDVGTDVYGEFFIAELMAAQNDISKTLVAQVEDKAVGLMALTKNFDFHSLQKHFHLENFDNLLKAPFMNSLRKRRAELEDKKKTEFEEERKELLKRLKEETVKCNRIAQRIELQEFCKGKEEEILKKVEPLTNKDSEETKKLDRKTVESILDKLLQGFIIRQPSDFFNEAPTDDLELVGNIQTNVEFLISTLTMFGLPEKYMEGVGHFPDWNKKAEDEMKKKQQKRTIAKKIKEKRQEKNTKKMTLKFREQDNKEPPKFFDLAPFIGAFKKFMIASGQMRSKFRIELKKYDIYLRSIFVDKDGEQTFKKCLDLITIGKNLQQVGFQMTSLELEVIGYMLICFGEVAFSTRKVMRMPEELKPSEEVKEQDIIMSKFQRKDVRKAKDEAKEEPPKPVEVTLYETSIHDFNQAVEKMTDYDITLHSLQILKANLDAELKKDFVETEVKEEKEEKKVEEKKDDQNVQEALEIFGGNEEEEEQETDYQKKLKSELEAAREKKDEIKKEHVEVEKKKKLKYSDDPEYEKAIEAITKIDEIPEAPERAKNAIAITMYLLEHSFESRACDFIQKAFKSFPDRDYLIITQPHNLPENPLLNHFIEVPKKSESTYPHVLYIIHRDSLKASDIRVRPCEYDDVDRIRDFYNNLGPEYGKISDEISDFLKATTPIKECFISEIGHDLINVSIITTGVNLPYYKSHFHIEDFIIASQHEREAHRRVIQFDINHIFIKSTKQILKEILRLTSSTCLYIEISHNSVIPNILIEMAHVRNRNFHHFLKQKWKHERFNLPEIIDFKKELDGGNKDPLDEEDAPFSLFLLTKKFLFDTKKVCNMRLVVVGASDCGISVIEHLLSISYMKFSHVTLIAPGGLISNQLKQQEMNLKAHGISYPLGEVDQLLLESRISVLDSRLIDIDRKNKIAILHDGKTLPYDILILTMGLQEKTLQSLKYFSCGIYPRPKEFAQAEGIFSIDDPYLYTHLEKGKKLIGILSHKKKPQDVVIYGRSLSSLCCIKGLIKRNVKPQNIILAIPSLASHAIDEFDTEEELKNMEGIINPRGIEDKDLNEIILDYLANKGVRVMKDVIIKEIKIAENLENPDKPELETVIFEKLGNLEESEQDEREANPEKKEDEAVGEEEEEEEDKEVNLREKKVPCKVLICCGYRDVDHDVFKAIINNSLVYNGRLVVEKNFQTNDPAIFAGGSLSTFSGVCKLISKGRPLEMHYYNGREIGRSLSKALLMEIDPINAGVEMSSVTEEQSFYSFKLPQGIGGVLPGDLYYYHIKQMAVNSKENPEECSELVCNNLKEDLKGNYIKFTFSSLGVIESVSYLVILI